MSNSWGSGRRLCKNKLICIHFSPQLGCAGSVYLEELLSYLINKTRVVLLTREDDRVGGAGGQKGAKRSVLEAAPHQDSSGVNTVQNELCIPLLGAGLSPGGECVCIRRNG